MTITNDLTRFANSADVIATALTVNSTAITSVNVGGNITTTGILTVGPFIENSITIDTNYTINTGKNALSAGPISIANGVTVTIPANSYWSVT